MTLRNYPALAALVLAGLASPALADENTGDYNGPYIAVSGGLATHTLGMEYLYNRYYDDKYFVAIGNGTAGPTNAFVLAGGVNFGPQDIRYDFHSFRAVLGFRF